MADQSSGNDQQINVTLSADDSGLSSGFNHAVQTISNLGKVADLAVAPIRSLGAEIDKVGTKIGHLAEGAGGGITGTFGLMARGAEQFQTEMAHVNTITDLSTKGIGSLGDSVLKLTESIPQSAKDMASSLYMIASAGFSANDSLTVLKQAGIAATAGMTDETAAGNALLQVLDAYGMSASQAANVNDTLFQTVKLGITDFTTLTQAQSDYVATAAAAHVKIQDVSAAWATMSVNGMQASNAGTSVNRVVEAFLKPSGDMVKVVHTLGYENAATMLQTLGLHDSIAKLSEITGGSANQMIGLFQNVHALNGVMALVNGNMENYNRIFGQMEDPAQRAGAAQKAFNTQVNTFQAQAKLAHNDMSVLSDDLGARLLPILTAGARTTQDFAKALDMIPGPVKEIIAIGGAFGGIFIAIAGYFAVTIIKAQLMGAAVGFVNKGLISLGLAEDEVIVAGNTLTGTILANVAAWTAEIPVLGTITGLMSKAAVAIPMIGAALAGAAIGYTLAENRMRSMTDAAQKFADQMQKGVDTTSITAVSQAMSANTEKINQLMGQQGTITQRIGEQFVFWADAKHGKHVREIQDLMKINDQYAAWEKTATTNLTAITTATGWTADSVEKLANTLGVDLGGAADKVVQRLIDAARAGGQDVDMFNQDVAAADAFKASMDALSKSLDEFTKASSVYADAQAQFNSEQKTGTVLSKTLNDANSVHMTDLANLARDTFDLSKAQDQLNTDRQKGIDLTIMQADLDKKNADIAASKAAQKLIIDQNTLKGLQEVGGSAADILTAQNNVEQDQADILKAKMDKQKADQAMIDAKSGKTYNSTIQDDQIKIQETQAKIASDNAKIVDENQKLTDDTAKAQGTVTMSLDYFIQYMKKAQQAQDDWVSNIDKLIARNVPQGVIDQWIAMGSTAATQLQQFVDLPPSMFDQYVSVMAAGANRGGQAFNDAVETEFVLTQIMAKAKAHETVQDVIKEIDQLAPGLSATIPDVQTAAKNLLDKINSGILPANQSTKDFLTTLTQLPSAIDKAGQAAQSNAAYLQSLFPAGLFTNPNIPPDQINAIIQYETSGGGSANPPALPPAPNILPGGLTPSGNAQGSFASNRPPMVSSRPILWAEAGEEAYIPLANHRRAAEGLLNQVAAHFGSRVVKMEAGGILKSDRSSGPTGYASAMPPQVMIVQVPIPERLVTQVQTGPILGVDMDDAMNYAKRLARQDNLRNPGRAVPVG